MAGVRVLLSFSLLCLTLHFIVNRTDASRKVKTLNYPVKDERIRIRRAFGNCKVHKNEVDKVHGFSQLTDYNVQSVINNGVKVTWEAPLGRNNSSPVGYWFRWFVDRDHGRVGFEKSSFVCIFLSAENTSFVVHESSHWRKDENISFAIIPLPRKSKHIRFGDSFKFKAYTTPRVRTSRKISTSTTESTNSDKTSRRNTKINTFAVSAEKKQNKEKEIFTFVVVAIACAAILILGVILVLRYRKEWKWIYPKSHITHNVVTIKPGSACMRKRPVSLLVYSVDPPDPGYIYVSYISESKGHTEKVVDFSNWFRKHGYDVQMDIISTPSNQEDLKELGRRRWGEMQLLRAKNVFIILSPPYLNLCRLDEVTTDASSLTQEEKIIYSEITQIRNELSSTAYISSRFIPVLFGVKETELPFWIKQLVVYSWPNDKMNNKLLYRINEEISYENEDITASNA